MVLDPSPPPLVSDICLVGLHVCETLFERVLLVCETLTTDLKQVLLWNKCLRPMFQKRSLILWPTLHLSTTSPHSMHCAWNSQIWHFQKNTFVMKKSLKFSFVPAVLTSGQWYKLKQKRVYGVENPHQRSISGLITLFYIGLSYKALCSIGKLTLK